MRPNALAPSLATHTAKTLKTAETVPLRHLGRLDHRLRAGWIILVTLLAAGCSAKDDDDGSTAQEASGRWSLPAAVRSEGAQVNIPYENAPYWNGGASCSGSLRNGSKTLGRELMDRFPQVKSIGGYACRRNTADGSRMSVHGTGKALDVFIPIRAGRANSDLGDPVANWLVTNADEIGIQLIIWNRSVWRSNGANEKPYSGPVPHIDHIHVEITERAARRATPWFAERSEVEAGVDDAGTIDTTADADPVDSSIGAPDAAKDAAVAQDGATKVDAALPPVPTPPTVDAGDDHGDDDAPHEDYDPSLDDTEPGESDSLGVGEREIPPSMLEEADDARGCAASPMRRDARSAGLSGVGVGLAGLLAISLVRRRRRP